MSLSSSNCVVSRHSSSNFITTPSHVAARNKSRMRKASCKPQLIRRALCLLTRLASRRHTQILTHTRVRRLRQPICPHYPPRVHLPIFGNVHQARRMRVPHPLTSFSETESDPIHVWPVALFTHFATQLNISTTMRVSTIRVRCALTKYMRAPRVTYRKETPLRAR